MTKNTKLDPSNDDGLQFEEDLPSGSSYFIPGCLAGGGIIVFLLLGALLVSLDDGALYYGVGLLAAATLLGVMVAKGHRARRRDILKGTFVGLAILGGILGLLWAVCAGAFK